MKRLTPVQLRKLAELKARSPFHQQHTVELHPATRKALKRRGLLNDDGSISKFGKARV